MFAYLLYNSGGRGSAGEGGIHTWCLSHHDKYAVVLSTQNVRRKVSQLLGDAPLWKSPASSLSNGLESKLTRNLLFSVCVCVYIYTHMQTHKYIYINIKRTFIYCKALQKDLLMVSMWYYVKFSFSLCLSHTYVQTHCYILCVCVRIALPLQSKARSKCAQNMRIFGSELLFLAPFFKKKKKKKILN